ncbi:TBC1 domain family member 31 isoform X1 [Monodelphis domestica]|nr:TBC1 domain family member 31 isoform X1 [Monodelphis domestica]XP_056679118.1 TBC1 domain family member 31 isoform X1 [Monodelphis domestica]
MRKLRQTELVNLPGVTEPVSEVRFEIKKRSLQQNKRKLNCFHSIYFTLSLRLIVNIVHTAAEYQPKALRFLNVAFDSTGDSFLAGDHQGNIYVFDLSGNRFTLVQRTLQASTALAFNLHRKTEFLVALADYSIKCFDTVTKELVSWMSGHESSVFSISVHASGRYAITTSLDTAQLWDLDTFQRKRKLNISQSVAIQKVFFLPFSNTILSCFRDNSIFAWECDTLICKYQLPPTPAESDLKYKVFAVTRDGRILAVGGKSNHLHLWCLETQQLFRIIQLPTKIRSIRHIEFIPDSFDAGSNQILGVLGQDGIMRFINIRNCKLLFDIGTLDEGICTSVISPNGRYITAIMENGSLNVYSVQVLTQEINKPPPPLVKVVEDLPKKTGPSQMKVRVIGGKVQRPRKAKDCKTTTKMLKSIRDTDLENKENDLPDGLCKKSLQTLLRSYGEYPTKYRMFIWRSLLQLPENYSAFNSLLDKGTHSAFINIHEKYPIKSRKLLRILQRTMSALAHWSAIFGDTPYLPLLAFPFVKLFQNNQLVCFEVIATLIINWCQHWFEYFPNPPINILSVIENLLGHHDKQLLQHYMNCGVTAQLYAWPLLETVFSEVLTREEWLRVFDNVFSNHPSFLLMIVVAYNLCCKAPLLNCSLKDDFEYFFHHRNNLDIAIVIREAYRLMLCTPADIHPKSMLDDFVPLTKSQYPVFNKYPKFIVDYQTHELEKIRNDELEYLKERQAIHEMEAEIQRQKDEDEVWYQKQELLREAEEKRRDILLEEEKKLLEQRDRLVAVKRDLKLKEIQLLSASRKRFLQNQQNQREMELRRLDDEIERKISLRDEEIVTTAREVGLQRLEIETQRRLLEQRLAKNKELTSQEIKEDLDNYRRKSEIEERRFQKAVEMDECQSLRTHKVIEESLADAEQACIDTDWQIQVLLKRKFDEAERKAQYEEIARLLQRNRAKEMEALNALKGLEIGKRKEDEEYPSWSSSSHTLLCDHVKRKYFNVTPYDCQQRQDERCGERPQELKTRSPMKHVSSASLPESHLRFIPGIDPETHFSLDRKREELEKREQELMSEIRNLRYKHTQQARQKRSIPLSRLHRDTNLLIT